MAVLDATQCCQNVSNLNPARASDRLVIPCPNAATKTCPTCVNVYCGRHFEGWHWLRDRSRPGSHGWCAARGKGRVSQEQAAAETEISGNEA